MKKLEELLESPMEITEEIMVNRERWLRALESGRYAKGKGELYSLKGKGKYCCLGVWWKLCDPKGFKAWTDDADATIDYDIDEKLDIGDPANASLTLRGRKTLGMTKKEMELAMALNDGEVLNNYYIRYNVEDLNNGWPFKKIAAFFRDRWNMPKG